MEVGREEEHSGGTAGRCGSADCQVREWSGAAGKAALIRPLMLPPVET